MNNEYYSGRDFEKDLVGAIDTKNPAYAARLKQLQALAVNRGWQPNQADALPFEDAMKLTKEFQPWPDSEDPQKAFAKDLRLAVADALKLNNEQDLSRLKFYTAVDGSLDAHHIDFFVILASTAGREEYVAFDITKNPEKDRPVGTDMILVRDIPDPSDPDYNEKEYLAKIDEIAKQTKEVFLSKMTEREIKKRQYKRRPLQPEAQV